MMDENKILRENLKHDEVVLEKTGHHVEVFGPYTKKELRRLLLSSLSLHPDTENEQEALEYIGISEQELTNIKSGENVSENIQEKLQDLEITEDMIKEAATRAKESSNTNFFDKRNSRSVNQNEEEFQNAEDDFIISRDNQIENNQKSFQNRQDELIESPNQKHLSDNMRNQFVLQNEITEEKISSLTSLKFSVDDDMKNLQKSGSQGQINQIVERDFARSAISKNASADYMSLNNSYLKSNVFAPIKKALCEIILRKPNDPVEFLGQWLLHFKVCEERSRKRKECEANISTEHEKSNMKQIFDTEVYDLIGNENQVQSESESKNTFEFSGENVTDYITMHNKVL